MTIFAGLQFGSPPRPPLPSNARRSPGSRVFKSETFPAFRTRLFHHSLVRSDVLEYRVRPSPRSLETIGPKLPGKLRHPSFWGTSGFILLFPEWSLNPSPSSSSGVALSLWADGRRWVIPMDSGRKVIVREQRLFSCFYPVLMTSERRRVWDCSQRTDFQNLGSVWGR